LDFSSTDNPGAGAATEAIVSPSVQSFPTPDAVYQDRSTGLLIFGIVEIIGGLLSLLAIPVMFLGLIIARKTGGSTPLNRFITLPLIYATLGGALLTLGIGATQAKRWARALNLILSWMWLAVGTLVTVMLVFVLPGTTLAAMREGAARNPGGVTPPAGVMAVILTLMIAFMAVFLVVLPLVFLLFYRSRNVELTCKNRDPRQRWTDRLPLPVIAYGFLASFGALYSLVAAVARPLFPFFGRYLTGLPAGTLLVAFALLDAVIAVQFFRRKVAGWWLALATLGLRMSSGLLTAMRGNFLDAYSRLGWSAHQLETMRRNPMLHGPGLVLWTLSFTILYFGLLLWTKRYFRAVTPQSYTESIGPLPSATATGL
jgi:hypothetical protein